MEEPSPQDRVIEMQGHEIEAIRAYAKKLEILLEEAKLWIVRMHGEKTMSQISPELKTWTQVLMAKSNSGGCHRL